MNRPRIDRDAPGSEDLFVIRIEDSMGRRLKVIVTIGEVSMAPSVTRLLEAKAQGLIAAYAHAVSDDISRAEAA